MKRLFVEYLSLAGRLLFVLPVLGFLRFYRVAVSPSLGQNCRYYPSCSAYAEEAVRRHGLWRGGFLAAHRLLRCNPWCRGGHDPVPQARAPAHSVGPIVSHCKRVNG